MEALLSFKDKAGLQELHLTCYIKNYSFLNSWLPNLTENTDRLKLRECYLKNLVVNTCLLALTVLPTNSLFFRICKATCKIRSLTFHESLFFSPRLPFAFYVPLNLLRWTIWILCYVTILLLLR